jgi:hypothetical protein
MAGPIAAAGGTSEPTQYAPLTMDRYLTGLWTQRSPLRDADVPYAYSKSYGSRFDSLIDGFNREISAKLTLIRRPGNSPFNSTAFAPIQSFYSFSFVVDGVQNIRVMADTAATVVDATPPGNSLIFTKSAGAGPSRFLSVGNECFFGNGKDEKKWLKGGRAWAATSSFNPGTLIIDSNGNLQKMYAGVAVYNVTLVEIKNSVIPGAPYPYLRVTFAGAAPKIPAGYTATFNGFTAYPALNGKVFSGQNIPPGFNVVPLGSNQLVFEWGSLGPANYGPLPDTGTMTVELNQPGISGGSAPAWASTWGAITTDGTIHWRNFGAQVENWGLAAPTQAPHVTPGPLNSFWAPYEVFNPPVTKYFYLMDSNGNLQIILRVLTSVLEQGENPPIWNPVLGHITLPDGWINCGVPQKWTPSTPIPLYQSVLDSNGNLQFASAITGTGLTGTTHPTWGTTPTPTTTDNQVTWQFLGPGYPLTTGSLTYAACYHGIDGSLSTASGTAQIGPSLGSSGGFEADLAGVGTTDPQCDEIWIYRTAQDGATLLRLDKIPNPGFGFTWQYRDTLPDAALNPFLSAPINHAADPPPVGFTGPAYHLQRVWGFVANVVYVSAGPDQVARGGNGATAFAAGTNFFTFPGQVIRVETITVNGGGVLVFTTSDVWIILGAGTPDSPFYSKIYIRRLGISGYNAMDVIGTTFYIFTNNQKMISLDPAAGYMEIGYPIGDQFHHVTTGQYLLRPTYDPATTYVTWHEKHSGDSAIYVSDGVVGWFRYSPVATPETGYVWHPRARIENGTSAVQSVEVAPGVRELLIGPRVPGPILKRDESINNDNGLVFPSFVIIGNIKLCDPGEIAEIAFITLDSMRVGQQPIAGLLLGEIIETANVKWDLLDYTCPDPPDLPASETLYNSRFVAMQNGVCPKCRHFQLLISWPDQDFPDELLTHTIYGAVHAERRQQ